MRRGFGLVQALIVIVLISGIMTIAMKYAQVTVKQTSDLYAKESAELFMDSAIELTLLAISGYERNTTSHCLHEVNITSADKRFKADINITTYYLLQDSMDYNNSDRRTAIQTEESHGMVMLEATVRVNEDSDANARIQGKHIRLTRRTLQRP